MKYTFLSLFLVSALALSACNTATVDGPAGEDMDVSGEGAAYESDAGMDDASESEEAATVSEEDTSEDEVVLSSFIDFSETGYDAALAAGKNVFLDFHADWCSTCLSNAPKIEAAFDGLDSGTEVMGFRVNYDDSAALQSDLGVTTQSTLVYIPAGDVDAAEKLGPSLVSTEDVLEFIQR